MLRKIERRKRLPSLTLDAYLRIRHCYPHSTPHYSGSPAEHIISLKFKLDTFCPDPREGCPQTSLTGTTGCCGIQIQAGHVLPRQSILKALSRPVLKTRAATMFCLDAAPSDLTIAAITVAPIESAINI